MRRAVLRPADGARHRPAWALNVTVTRYVLTHGFEPLAYATVRYGSAALIFLVMALVDRAVAAGVCARTSRSSPRRRPCSGSTSSRSCTRSTWRRPRSSRCCSGRRRSSPRCSCSRFVSTASDAASGSGAAVSFLGVGARRHRRGRASCTAATTGILLGIATAATWAGYSVAIAPLMRRYSPTRISALVLGAGWIAISLTGARQTCSQDFALGWDVWALLVFATLGPLVLTNLLWFRALHRIGAARATLAANLNPFVAAIIALAAALRADDACSRWRGGVLIAAGIVVARRPRSLRSRKTPAASPSLGHEARWRPDARVERERADQPGGACLRLRRQRDASPVRVADVGLDDDRRAADMERLAVASTCPSRTARKKFVFDSIVLVCAPSGRLRKAHTAPSASASAITAPPWSTPPAVVSSGAQASRPVTLSGEASVSSIPSVPANGIASRRSRRVEHARDSTTRVFRMRTAGNRKIGDGDVGLDRDRRGGSASARRARRCRRCGEAAPAAASAGDVRPRVRPSGRRRRASASTPSRSCSSASGGTRNSSCTALRSPRGHGSRRNGGRCRARFLDDPEGSARAAEGLVARVMEERGYPARGGPRPACGRPLRRASAGRQRVPARLCAPRRRAREARDGTESLRQAMRSFRTAFEELAADRPRRARKRVHTPRRPLAAAGVAQREPVRRGTMRP